MMSSFDCDDFSRDGQDTLRSDQRSSSEVGGYTDVLEDASSGNHGCCGGEAEVVDARLNRLGSCAGNGRGKGRDVCLFRADNRFKV